MLVHLGVAAQLAIVAHAPDTVSACDAVEVSVAVNARGAEIPRIVAPPFAPFDILRASSPRVQYNGRSSVTVEHRYIVTTDRAGRFTIPPFEARTSAARVVSEPTVVTVRPPRGRGSPVVVTRARVDTSSDLDVRAAATVDTVYVGQQATYEVAVFLNETVRNRLRRNPTFYPPEMQAMLAYDLPTPLAAVRPRSGSQCFDALVYRRALFPLVAGRLVIPPAQLVYNTGLSPTMYTREESHELQTDSVAIVALEPPLTGRPPEYAGAVGDLRLDLHLDTATARVGDPLLFTVRVTGTGNVKLFPRPAVRLPWAGLIAADERVRVDSASARVAGVKEFDWVLTPRLAGEFDLPPVRYGYFDPGRRRYEVATSDGRTVRVRPGALASSDTGSTEGALGIRIHYGGAAWPPLHTLPAFWLVMALAPLPALIARTRRRSPARPGPAADPTRDLLQGLASDEPVALRRRFVRGLAARIGCNPEDFTHVGALRRALVRAGVSTDTADTAEGLLRELDAAAYSGTRTTVHGAAARARKIARAVDAEALARAELPFWIPALLVAAALGTAGVAVAADLASTHFARGVSAYVGREYAGARTAFADAATLEPRSVDAWANFGTASWTVGDTAAAVFGWRQALAIDPAAGDLRQRLALAGDAGPTSPGWVPGLPRGAATWLFVVLWLSAWSLAWLARRPHPWAGRWPTPLALSAVLVGLLAIELETRVSGTRLGVVRRASALSSDPAFGMDRGPALATGEIVRISGRRVGWIRVAASSDRVGWLPASQLLPLEERRVPRD